MDVLRLGTADEMLTRAGNQLRAAGAEGELTLGILGRLTHEPDAWGSKVSLLLGTDDGVPVAVVSQTGSHPALIVGFGDGEGVDYAALAAALIDDHRPEAVNGAVRWVEPFAQAWVDAGAGLVLQREMRAFELRAVRPPRQPEGTCRPAGDEERELMEEWVIAFGDDVGEPVAPDQAHGTVSRLLRSRDLWIWERDGRIVSMAGITRRTDWSSNVALVYTPAEERGNGYASAVVAHISQLELDAGQDWCALFTDIANPTSNHIYAEIGYEPRCDFHLYGLEW